MLGDKERCIEAGCDTWISKPPPIPELIELIQRYEIGIGSATSTSGAGPRASAEAPRTEP
ncbi:MAG: hypothetical protein IPK19_16700 [Chloroflexi bacterium]|nr:hypothetical protein [Chloroflexota bacterium]